MVGGKSAEDGPGDGGGEGGQVADWSEGPVVNLYRLIRVDCSQYVAVLAFY